jgi:Ca2+-binding RTX toxin-like protein
MRQGFRPVRTDAQAPSCIKNWPLLSILALVIGSVLATLVALPNETAFAKRMLGTRGNDRIVGTNKPDRIIARRGNDRVNGRKGGDRIRGSRGKDHIKGAQGRDRLLAGKGADHLNAVDGKADRAVNGGPGKDVCAIDQADLAVLKGCERTKVAGGGGGGGAGKCVGPGEDKLQATVGRGVGGASRELKGDAPPTFSPAFYAITVTLNASADGLAGQELPISIEEVCDVPKSLAKEAAQLAGGDGVAIVGPDTKVFDGDMLLQGQAATTALAGADTVTLRARLKHPGKWAQDEDGQPVPTFAASRINITD